VSVSNYWADFSNYLAAQRTLTEEYFGVRREGGVNLRGVVSRPGVEAAGAVPISSPDSKSVSDYRGARRLTPPGAGRALGVTVFKALRAIVLHRSRSIKRSEFGRTACVALETTVAPPARPLVKRASTRTFVAYGIRHTGYGRLVAADIDR
jgi:hypothetical protein